VPRHKLKVGDTCKGKYGPHFIASKADLKTETQHESIVVICRKCRLKISRAVWDRTKDRKNKQRRELLDKTSKRTSDALWRTNHKEYTKIKNREYVERSPERYLLYSAKRRAKKYGVPFALIPEDITIPKACPVLGTELKRGVGGSTDNSPTLDRHIPSLGYVKGNIDIISSLANRIKTDATLEQVEKVLNWMKLRRAKQ
jgi:hypothetical protein